MRSSSRRAGVSSASTATSAAETWIGGWGRGLGLGSGSGSGSGSGLDQRRRGYLGRAAVGEGPLLGLGVDADELTEPVPRRHGVLHRALQGRDERWRSAGERRHGRRSRRRSGACEPAPAACERWRHAE
eukprot:scaffold13739_cov58-Phaeocystis_antarctica.AAC.6